MQWSSGGELMSRSQQDAPYTGQPGQLVDARAVLVECQRDRAHRGGVQDRPVETEPVRFHGQRAVQDTGPRQQPQGMGESRADHDPLGSGADAARAPQVVGESAAELDPALGVTGAEGVVRRRVQGAPGGGEPGGARERTGVRPALPQVVDRARRTVRRPLRYAGGRHGRGAPGDQGPGTLTGGQPAFRDQLGVGVGDRVAGQAEIGGERPVGRQPGPGGQPPVPYGVAQRADEDGPAAARSGQVEEQIAADPLRGIDP